MSLPIQRLLADPDTFTTVLLAIVLDKYGTDALKWAPQTIVMELHDDFHVQVPQANIDQIVVGLNLMTSDDFYARLPKFVQICNVLAGAELSESFDKADAWECAWGVTEAALLWPAANEREPFSVEIQHYIGHVLDEAGIKNPPGVLRSAFRKQQAHNLEGITTDDGAFAAEYGVDTSGQQRIEEMLSDNLSRLLQQLATMPGFKPRVDELVNDLRRAS
jgi:hypothetical protein